MNTVSVFDSRRLRFECRSTDVENAISITFKLLLSNNFIAIKRDDGTSAADMTRLHRFLRKNFRVETRDGYWVVYRPQNKWFG
jgi:hypothetical protein